MSRARERVTLENGLKLDLNRLARKGFVKPGAYRGSGISWTNSYTGEELASGWVTADMLDPQGGWLRIKLGELDQTITLTSHPRHFGGRQWYFVCPRTTRTISVLWMPPGARSFASRQHWGRQAAYHSQFLTPIDRAHRGKARINSRLCAIGGCDPDEWELPPKSKWMRWRTYNRAEAKFDQYEASLEWGLADLKLFAKIMAGR